MKKKSMKGKRPIFLPFKVISVVFTSFLFFQLPEIFPHFLPLFSSFLRQSAGCIHYLLCLVSVSYLSLCLLSFIFHFFTPFLFLSCLLFFFYFIFEKVRSSIHLSALSLPKNDESCISQTCCTASSIFLIFVLFYTLTFLISFSLA